MELHELHVLQRHAGAVSQRHAVAGLDGAVGREGIDPPGAARAEDDRRRGDRHHLPGAQLAHRRALAAAVMDQKLQREPLVVAREVGMLERRLKQRVQQVEAGLIGGEPGPLAIHAAERPHRHGAVGRAAPGTTPVLELQEFPGCLAHEALDGILIGQVVGARQRVVNVLLEAVVGLDDAGGAPFGRDRVGAHRIDLGDDPDR
jgi:hypothetical protein